MVKLNKIKVIIIKLRKNDLIKTKVIIIKNELLKTGWVNPIDKDNDQTEKERIVWAGR